MPVAEGALDPGLRDGEAPDAAGIQSEALRVAAASAESGAPAASAESPASAGSAALPDTRSATAAAPLAAGQKPGGTSPSAVPAHRATCRPEPAAPPHLRPKAAKKVLIFVIDDAGNNSRQLEPFLKLPFPLTIAVLPGLPYSLADAHAVKAASKELILHQPMEAVGGQDPGPGALRLGMDPATVAQVIDANLRTVPGAVGMNNHMGSAVTADPQLMDAVAAVAKERGIYYLNSLTISGTATALAARREGIRYWERSVFLDNTPDRVSIFRAVDDGKKRATKGGSAIMIGHVWSAELAQALMELYPQLVEEGFSLSTISRFMIQEAEEDDESPRN